MDRIRFEGRDLHPWADFVADGELVEGETYFRACFVDEQMLVPELRPLVFIGTDYEIGDSGILYFQDAASYLAGVRYGSSTIGRQDGDDDVEVHRVKRGSPFVQTFEKALDTLLRCSVSRSRLKDAG